MSAAYRVRQFIRAVGAWIQPREVDEALLSRHLPRAAVSLFQTMPRYDQHHALNVLRTLQEMGHSDPDLLAAALLHDLGKTGDRTGALHLWHRVAVVLMRACWPGLLEHIAQDRPRSCGVPCGVPLPRRWRRPFFVQQHHAEIGAELARRAGCSPGTADLIRHHEDPPDQNEGPLRAALRSADGAN